MITAILVVAVFVYILMAYHPSKNRLGVLKKSHTLVNAHYWFKRTDKKWKKFPWKLYKEMCTEFMNLMVDELFAGNTLHFWGIGTMRIVRRKFPQKVLKIDFIKTKELGYVVYHSNKHSNGFFAHCRWHKKKGRTPGLAFYRFDFVPKAKARLGKAMKSSGQNNFQRLLR